MKRSVIARCRTRTPSCDGSTAITRRRSSLDRVFQNRTAAHADAAPRASHSRCPRLGLRWRRNWLAGVFEGANFPSHSVDDATAYGTITETFQIVDQFDETFETGDRAIRGVTRQKHVTHHSVESLQNGVMVGDDELKRTV